jgi:2-methylfumaryl-CoA isomerase
MVTALTPRQWEALVDATDTRADISRLEDEIGADLSDEGARFVARNEIAGILQPWFKQRSYRDVAAALDEYRACWGPYQSFRQLVDEDPRVDPDHNPMWSIVDQPGVGSYPMPGAPLGFSAVPRMAAKPAPRLGADTNAVLSDVLGLSEHEIDEVRRAGII